MKRGDMDYNCAKNEFVYGIFEKCQTCSVASQFCISTNRRRDKKTESLERIEMDCPLFVKVHNANLVELMG